MKALRVKQSSKVIDELYSLACGPDTRVHACMGCIVNGVRFHTKDCDDRRITQNSGICVVGEHDGEKVDVTPHFPGVPLTTVNMRKSCMSHIMRPIRE